MQESTVLFLILVILLPAAVFFAASLEQEEPFADHTHRSETKGWSGDAHVPGVDSTSGARSAFWGPVAGAWLILVVILGARAVERGLGRWIHSTT